MHRPLLVFRQPNLLSIDGIPISAEERAKADMYFLDYQVFIILYLSLTVLNKLFSLQVCDFVG